MNRPLAMILASAALAACGTGEPTRSYCEALCDWAVPCHGAERTLDEAAALDACLAATRASDDSCAKAEDGSIDPASKQLLETCVAAVDEAAAAGECDPYTGSIDELKTGAPPAECLGQGADAVATFEAAREATIETNDQLCQRFTDTFCERTEQCILGDFAGEIPDEVITAMGGTPFELCVQRLEPVTTADCRSEQTFAPEASLDDVNTQRQSARECLRDFSTISCEDLFAGELSEVCAGSFTDPQQALDLATALYGLSEDFAAAVP